MHRLEDVIEQAWRLPEMARWDPNTSLTCRVTIVPKALPSGLILPPGMMPRAPVEPQQRYFVDFQCEHGTVNGAPAYQIKGTCNGTTIVVHQGFMERRRTN